MTQHQWMPLIDVLSYEPEMHRLKVSAVARSSRGFLTAYKRAGKGSRMTEAWRRKREAFIARHLAQYRKNPTYRRQLALIAWAYKP